jgi:hypothetical protein
MSRLRQGHDSRGGAVSIPVDQWDEVAVGPNPGQAMPSIATVERFIVAFEKIAAALSTLATIEQKKFDKLYPPEAPKRDAIISRPDDDEREQFSDRPSDKWLAETEEATPEGKSRFRERFETPQAGDNKRTIKKERGPRKDRSQPRSTRPVPKGK